MSPRRRRTGILILALMLGAGTLAAAPVRAGGVAVGFGKALLSLERSERPTSLQFGPDGRLYVAQLDGTIYAYAIARDAANSYRVVATETIPAIRSIPNHDDDGTPNPTLTGRFVTGMLTAGTAARPVLYVTSSDPRIGNAETGDTGLDTNSGALSRLTWNGTQWRHRVLVRGLPRSEEVHATNGLALDAANGTMFIAQGGHTNMGAPSAQFNFLPEYALSGAILSVDLDALGTGPYDLPTLNDRTRPGSPDANDPFGGNDGRNQAKIVPGGPVQVYSPGFRNPYDVAFASNGRLYATDNGPNAGAGGLPAGEGPGGACTDEPQEPGETAFDSLHLVEGPDDYNGAPNPTRGNEENTWGKQSPVAAVGANPVECDFLQPGPARGSLATFPESTDGIAEYTASNFEGAMQGDLLLTTLLDNLVSRVQLSGDGTTATSVGPLFSGVAKRPLDVTTQPDAGPFPGTIWVADHPSGKIVVFEPNDYDGTPPPCTGADDDTLDEDGDGYDNADELANGTDPCSAADVPPDADGDLISNQADPDDDNDGSGDTVDPFAVDPDDGRTTPLPLRLTWDAGDPSQGGLLDSGFTGLMSDGVRDYEDRFDPSAMTVGSATGSLVIDAAGEGTSHGAANTQDFGFQTGLDVAPTTGVFRLRGRVVAPFGEQAPEPGQAVGIMLGTGGQDDYVELSLTDDGASFLRERNGTIGARRSAALSLPGPDAVDLILEVDPAASTVQPRYAVVNGGAADPAVAVGSPVSIPSAWIATSAGLAVGVTATSEGPAPTFPAVWDSLKATVLGGGARVAASPGGDEALVRGGVRGEWVARASTGMARSEVSYTRLGDRLYLAWGGPAHQAYNPKRDRWKTLAPLPDALNHIQSVALDGKIYSIGGLKVGPGSPKPNSNTVWIYDPATDSFSSGAPMPAGRERGAGGVAVHDGLIYYAGGLHLGVAVAWVDVYDPVADEWTSLPDMPRPRDHFQAAVIDDTFYAIGGRVGNGTTPFGDADALDLVSGDWTTGLAPLPTPRAGYAVALLEDEILVIGGEGFGKAFRKVEAYDPVADSWRTLAPMPTPRHGIQAAVWHRRVFVADGGTTQAGTSPTSVQEMFRFAA